MTATTIGQLAAKILDSACPNGGEAEDGYNIYYIEVHCVRWAITAKKNNRNWIIKEATAEPW